MENWIWPLTDYKPAIPVGSHDGAFGTKRRFDMHTGVDLYCPDGAEVVTVEEGVIVGIEVFTGPRADSPWWRRRKRSDRGKDGRCSLRRASN
jgi:hypothetical protein